MNILFASSEAAPFCKTGGLADVVGSLPQALARMGEQVSVILPLYECIGAPWREKMHFDHWGEVHLAWRRIYYGLFSLEQEGVTYYFVDNEAYFKRGELYGYYDDGERFGYFSRAVTEVLKRLPQKPDIVHCNDWQTALVPVYCRDEAVHDDFYRGIRTVLTLHNIEYQGRYGKELLGDLFGLAQGWYDGGTMEFSGDISLLKGGIMMADAITAVSPTYADELQYAFFAHGMEGTIAFNRGKMHGILNGIDVGRYDPHTDKNLNNHYTAARMDGKAKCKARLQQRMELSPSPDTPIIAMVTRLVSHKGLDLVCAKFDEIMQKDVQFVLLGKGEAQYESFFAQKQAQYAGRVSTYFGYDEALASGIYAGADLFLMPSRTEPCGLSQMIAMRYGTLPIVRETGGLKDTVQAYEAWCGAGNGFRFADYNADDMCHVIGEAVDLYRYDRAAFRKVQKSAMTADFSWTKSAGEYRNVYQSIIGG